ncbi:UvrD-helicase domain-containing protein, partial [Lachnoclostridium sp. MSJ-17]|uniref:UvrD-helicase domain-containing protein n=1 Tax=Lachnoclostridium sp. MSJ-17 TaxID=2841516 RepID=UPI001C1198AA
MPENEVRWTDDQLDAINSGGTVLVSAAAGSGKTAVLAQHVLELITGDGGVDVDRLLVLTFTRDAAAEMKKRIQKELDKRIVAEGASTQLLRQKQKLYTAHISTTDSFCSSLVREHFSVLNIEPDFRIAGDDEIATVSSKALDTVFESFYAAGSPDFVRLLRSFASGGDDKGLREAVLSVHGFLQNQPFRSQWLDEMVKRYTAMTFSETEWAQELFAVIPDELDSMLSELTGAINLNPLTPALEDILLPLLENDGKNIIELRNGFESGGYGVFSERAEKLFGAEYEENPEIPDKLQKGKKTAVNKIFGCRAQIRAKVQSYLGADGELRELSGLMVTLSELVSAYDREISALKDRRNIRTFSDVSALTVKLLAMPCQKENSEFCTGGFYYRRTELAKELSTRFKQVIIDEYQDVNLIQEVIYNCVSDGGKNLFMVGDIKQSIYGFRQSKAKLFNERKNRYAPYDRENPVYPATIYLSKNFRSCQQVCETVNFIFSRIMAEYKPEEYLNFGADSYVRDKKRDTEISLIYRDKFSENYSVTGLEARYTAGRIKEMINSGYTVRGRDGERPLRYGDIAVLMRAKSAAETDDESKQKGSAEFVRQLGKYGIPAYCEESENIFDAREIKLILNILRVIDNPSNDVALLAVLLSPVYGFTPDDLAVIRLGSGKASLYRSLNICRDDDSDTGRKAARFLDELQRFRDLASVSTVDELLESVYERTAIIAVTSAVNGGAYPAGNLDLMRVYARKFSSNGYKTLSDFNGYISRLLSGDRKLASASRIKGDSADCVQVMSIHKSKGLEFPVCFLVDTAHKFNEMDFRSNVLCDSEEYVGIRPLKNFVRTPTFPYRAITMKKRRENTDEEMRMLYVALTRAKEKLIIVGTDKDINGAINKAAAKTIDGTIKTVDIYSSKRMLDWILFSAAVNPSTRALIDE